MSTQAIRLTGTVAVFIAAAACESQGPVRPSEPEAGAAVHLQGAGATFPYPLYSKWVSEYEKSVPDVRIDYQSIGSGGGIRQIIERTVDFGASDAPMTDAELAKAPGILHLPMTLGAVAVVYNLPGAAATEPKLRLRLGPETLAGIFLGDVRSWNDPAIVRDNPEARLPADPITVVHRSDGSGTTAVFTDYLARVSGSWQERVGTGKSVRFPAGLGAKGNEGVAGQVKSTPGSIGYAELAYARQTGLAYAALVNKAGKAVEPSLAGVAAAAASVTGSMPDDLRVSIVDAPGDAAYPIASFSYVLIYEEQPNRKRGLALGRFLSWALHDGQRFGAPLDYAPLPAAVVERADVKLRSLRSNGTPLLGENRGQP